MVWAICALVLSLGWAAWCLARSPRCPHCRSTTEAQPSERLPECAGALARIGFRCPACRQIVADRIIGTWD